MEGMECMEGIWGKHLVGFLVIPRPSTTLHYPFLPSISILPSTTPSSHLWFLSHQFRLLAPLLGGVIPFDWTPTSNPSVPQFVQWSKAPTIAASGPKFLASNID